ncbi:amino acid adenylation domain-containing protein, partial [Chryseobacterium sp. JV558]|uniref:non-ribosomal peptide synthetase n=1 Tax=Chryseobacterium sp. JV558 TaxID=2663236 RepID=UPI00299F23A6
MKLVEEIIRDIINSLNEIDAKISILDGNLKIDAKVGTVSNDLIVLIKENKEDLITYLKEGKLKDSFLIPKSPPSEDYPLSPGQQQIWTAMKFGGIGAYNLPILLNIEGEIDVSVLKRAIDALLRQHEVLRSVFFEQKNGEARQAIKENWNEDVFMFTDFSVEANAEKSYQLIIKNAVTENFDFAQNLLIRFKLLKISENKYIFICIMHHIISDGWSMNVIVNDIFELYYKISSNQYTATPKHRIQYKDYAVWQRSRIENGETKIEKDYWLKKLEGSQDPITIQPDKKRPQIKKYEGEIISKALDRNAVSALKELVGTEQATLFMGFLTLAKVLLFKYTAETDIVIGCPISGRNYLELENQIGFYVNTVPYRTQFNAEDSYKSLLKKVKKTTFEAFQYEQFPHEEIASGLNYQGYKYGNPFFNVLLALQNQNNVLNYGFEKNDSNNIKISPFDDESDLGLTSSKFDLIFNFEEADHENMLSIEFDSEIYERKTVERLADHMSILLACVVTDPEIPIKDLLLLSAVEEQELKDYNITQSVYPQEESIISLFEKQVKSTPNHIALIFEDNQLTYKELDDKSNQLSRYLLSRYSLGKGVLCGIRMDRSLEMIVSILAILKTGSGYVPIDVDYPQDRIDYIVEDSGCILVIDSALYADFTSSQEAYDNNSLELSMSDTDLAYVIYTSGTTGHPKGVMVEHKGVIRLISETNYLPSQKSDVLLSLSTFSFDGSVFDIFYALLNGLQLVVPTKEEMFDFKVLSDIIEKHNVTAFFITTAFFNSFVDSELFKISKVQYILFGGEKVSLQHVRKAIEKWPSVQLVHVYGPTENTTFSTFYNVGTVNEDLYTIPIGRPISNSEVFILDDDRNLLPHGIAGEICVSGFGLAQGYLSRPELTSDKFVPHPFKEGERLYRTGDLGRWNYQGYVEFMGRNDDQVKIRGYRIELGEIAQVMSQHPLITNCLVHASEGSSENKELILYYVSESSLSIRDLRSYLSERLPSYMIPGYYMQLAELPLTSNGKVDRKALPMPEDMGIDTGVEYVSPQTSTEKILV